MIGSQYDQGVLVLAVKDIFNFIEVYQDQRQINLWGSYMEVYNEQINDLLDQNNNNIKLREDPIEGYYVSGLKTIKLSNL